MVLEVAQYQQQQQFHNGLHGSNNINGLSNSHGHDSITNNVDTMKTIGRTVKSALLKAQAESRVILGFRAAIQVLSQAPEGSLFCLMAVPPAGDAATHMHEVLLEAFCYEHDIYVIKVDCPLKLNRILGKNAGAAATAASIESCCLVQKPWTGGEEDQLNKCESLLVDFCEECWDAPQRPVVELPAV